MVHWKRSCYPIAEHVESLYPYPYVCIICACAGMCELICALTLFFLLITFVQHHADRSPNLGKRLKINQFIKVMRGALQYIYQTYR